MKKTSGAAGLRDAVEDYLESCARVTEDIVVVERLLRPENLEVSLKCVLKHATSRGSNTFQLFDTSEKLNHFARQENGQNEWYDLEYQGGKAKALPCPDQHPCRLSSFSKARRRLKKKKKLIGS